MIEFGIVVIINMNGVLNRLNSFILKNIIVTNNLFFYLINIYTRIDIRSYTKLIKKINCYIYIRK